ncbi:hypothetical protein T492DRAFT_985844 [Pavlovales sp. CCMP2436]|nr:hypothetical protein T492DRAFT_985844 [Pavlovales sp. CCMP2436]
MNPLVLSALLAAHRGAGAVARCSLVSPSLARLAMSSTAMVMDPTRWKDRLTDATIYRDGRGPVPVTCVPKGEWTAWLASQPLQTRTWLEALGRNKFKDGEVTAIPSATGGLSEVIMPVEKLSSIWALSALPAVLPAGNTYALRTVGPTEPTDADAAALGWLLGCYDFTFLKTPAASKQQPPRLLWPENCNRALVAATAKATYLCRDLITAPAEHLGPAELDIHLTVLLAVVENSISGNSFRPGDVLVARNGITTEIGNTDAEGRLVLADALVLACEGKPELIIDMATLTGASRVALGADVPSIFSNNDALALELQLKSSVADLRNIGAGPYGGAITAALYLSEFVNSKTDLGEAEPAETGGSTAAGPKWLHMDVMAYNTASSPGRPEGGEAMGMRAFFALLAKRYPKASP